MKTRTSRMAAMGLFFVVVFLSGFGLSGLGKPYGTLIFTVHKLIAMAAVISLGVATVRSSRLAALSALARLSVGVTGGLFLVTIITGSLLSIGKVMPAIVGSLHQTTPYLTVLATAASLLALPGATPHSRNAGKQVLESSIHS
jgi:hypothetical protein